MALTEQQEQAVSEAATALDNATILDTLGNAIAANDSLIEEYAYLRGRAGFHRESGKALLESSLGVELKEN